MEKQIGMSAGVVALLVFFVHALVPPAGERAAAPGKQSEDSSSSNAPAAAKMVPLEGPWLASRQYFHQEPAANAHGACMDYLLPDLGKSPPANCSSSELRALFGLGAEDIDPNERTTLIATIPDPIHTRMSLQTDRYLNALQQAAFRVGWELATQWLPWTAKAGQISTTSPGSNVPNLDLEKMPGLLVFRRHFVSPSVENKCLLVFIVGETPTAGINGFQFEAAVRSIAKLHPSDTRPIGILGPTFSGSFLSLTKLIRGDSDAHAYDIRAGSVSNSVYAQNMLVDLTRDRKVTFHGSTLPSASFDNHFRKLALDQGFPPDRLAELVEDESGFSFRPDQASSSRTPDITIYRYPRDIAQLRNAYSDIAFSPSQKPGAVPSQALEFSLKDTQSGENTFPMFSTSHTPVSQNAVLEQIIQDINARRVRLLSLSATNIFDTIFLAKVLHKECPDLRVVLNGADLLFVQEAAQGSLTGLLAISPFPMFPQGFVWANSDEHDHITFADADSVGEYNAALSLLDGKVDDRQGLEPSFTKGSKALFSAWLLVLGRTGWLPVDLLDQDNRVLSRQNKSVPEQNWFDPGSESHLKPHLDLPPAPLSWNILCILSAILSLGVCGRLVYLKVRACLPVWSSLCLSDLFFPKKPAVISRLAHARYLCLFACLSSLAFVNGVLFVPMEAMRFANRSPVADPSLEWLSGIAFALPLVIAFVLFRWIPVRLFQRDCAVKLDLTQSYLYRALFLRVVLLFWPLIALAFWLQLCLAAGARGPLLCFRVFALSPPVSPIWPLVLTGLTFVTVAFFHLRRFTWVDHQQPGLETKLLDQALWGQLKGLKRRFDLVVSSPVHLSPKRGLISFVVVTSSFSLLVLLFPEESLRSFERRVFEKLLIALLIPLAIFIAATFIQFASSWSILRALLTTLNSLAIGRFFARLPDFDGSGPVWIRDLKLMSLATSVNSAIALHNLELAMPSLKMDRPGYWNTLKKFLAPECPGRLRSQFIADYRKFRNKAAEVSRTLSCKVLLPYWLANPIPFVQAVEKERAKTNTDAKAPALLTRAAAAGASAQTMSDPARSLTTAPADGRRASEGSKPACEVSTEAYEMASKYVVLQYAVFIGYALRHLQNLLLCCALSFTLLVLALHSFSFQAPQAISRFLILALAAGAVIVIRVLAQIERNPVISRMSGTEEGQLSKDFYLRVLTYGALPVLTVISTQFPAIARFITSWAQPTIEAMR